MAFKRPTLALVALAAFLSARAEAADGWQKVTWGMSDAEVAKVYPESVATDDQHTKGCPRFLHAARMMPHRVRNAQFDATFCLDSSGRLAAVSLVLTFPKSSSGYLVEQLRRKYGEPERIEGDNEHAAFLFWHRGATVIKASQFWTPKYDSEVKATLPSDDGLDIDYIAAIGEDNDGL
jgi:hypothetical protein